VGYLEISFELTIKHPNKSGTVSQYKIKLIKKMNVRFLTSNQILLGSPRLRSANVTVESWGGEEKAAVPLFPPLLKLTPNPEASPDISG